MNIALGDVVQLAHIKHEHSQQARVVGFKRRATGETVVVMELQRPGTRQTYQVEFVRREVEHRETRH